MIDIIQVCLWDSFLGLANVATAESVMDTNTSFELDNKYCSASDEGTHDAELIAANSSTDI